MQEHEITMNRPLVSIVMPVFNGARYIGAALQSAFAQEYRPIELIVVDDGSTDTTAEIVGSFKEVIYLYQSNQGVSGARNKGISVARGEFIAFLDSDDLWTPNKLTLQIDWLLEHAHVGYVAARFRNFLEKGVERPGWIKEEQLSEEQVGGMPNLVVRRSVFEKIGLFDAGCRSGSDLDWILRAKDAGIKGAVLSHTLLYRRIHDSNVSHQWQGSRTLLMKALRASVNRRRVQNNDH
jgi:glycosyltransferase involved in cell wall biosynthesis